jgi:hypothetical protein
MGDPTDGNDAPSPGPSGNSTKFAPEYAALDYQKSVDTTTARQRTWRGMERFRIALRITRVHVMIWMGR